LQQRHLVAKQGVGEKYPRISRKDKIPNHVTERKVHKILFCMLSYEIKRICFKEWHATDSSFLEWTPERSGKTVDGKNGN
jgi:hypothetical protein